MGNGLSAPTIRDVAQEAGVSHMTVSRVFGGQGRVAQATQERVRTAAERLGYRPNVIARSLAQSRTHTLGFVIGDLNNPLYAEVTQSLHRAARERGYDLLIALDEGREDLEAQQLEHLLDRRVDGILLWGGPAGTDYPHAERSHQQPVPCVVLGTRARDARMSFVAVDHLAGMEQAVDHLLKMGRTRLGYVGSDVGLSTHYRTSNYEGFLMALRQRDLEPATCIRSPSPGPAPRDARAVGYAVGRGLAAGTDRPDALVCVSDRIAFGVIAGLRDGGLRAPRDMAIVGYDGIAEGEFSHPRLTTVAQPVQQMIELGLETLFHLMEEPGMPPPRMMIEPRLVVRESCGAAPSSG